MRGLTRIIRFQDNENACYASLRLGNGEPCHISVARKSIIVRRSRFGLFGRKLYRELDAGRNAAVAEALDALYPANLLPRGFSNPMLSAFTNSVLQCGSAEEVTCMFGEATRRMHT